MEGPIDGHYKELQGCSQARAWGYGSKLVGVVWGCCEGVMAKVRRWTIRDGRARGCLVLDLNCLNVQEGESPSVEELDSES